MQISSAKHNDEMNVAARSLYIDGQWVRPLEGEIAAGRLAAVVNPATEAVIAEVALGSARDVDAAVAAARKALPAWADRPVGERADFLEQMYHLIMERKEAFAQAISREMGAAIAFARASQVPFAADHLRVAKEVALAYPFLKVEGHTALSREPIGVCALVTPWNWPLFQITAKVSAAFAAGCTVVLKPSELAPLTAQLFAQVVHDCALPAGVFNLVLGTGEEVGSALAAHEDVDMISITGSNRAGISVAEKAAATVKRVTQELGGKSPNVLLPDADFEKVVPIGVMTAFRNVGQSCSAPTRMIVPRANLAEVEAIARATIDAVAVGDPASEETVLGPIANRAQYERVQTMIEAGIAEGAKLVCGGPGRIAGQDRGFYARPTVFSEVRTDMRIAQEEIFGPVLSILPYDTIEEAVAIANDTIYGLGAHVQGRDLARARSVARRIQSGQVHINHPGRDPLAPFGGFKRSGNGREYGRFGMEEFLETKAILGYA